MVSARLKLLSVGTTLLVLAGSASTYAAGSTLKHRSKPGSAAPASTNRGAADLNAPSTDFSGVEPQLDDPQHDQIVPKKNRNDFFDQKIR